MKFITPSFEIWEQGSSCKEDMLRHIERCGRVCYKSEDKITDTSHLAFYDRILKSGHRSVLEHGHRYFTCEDKYLKDIRKINGVPTRGCAYTVGSGSACIAINHRADIEHAGWDTDDFDDPFEELPVDSPTKNFMRFVTVHFVLSRQIANELVRHRIFSFSQESTRYCNYSKGKFGKELTFCMPEWVKLTPGHVDLIDDPASSPDADGNTFLYWQQCRRVEDTYMRLLAEGCKPQDAAAVLPLTLKTELVMTGFVEDWKDFFNLRCAPDAHPEARRLAIPLREEFIRRGLMKEGDQ